MVLDKLQAWYDSVHTISDAEFKANFRVTKRTFAFLCNKLSCMSKQDTGLKESITVEKRVALALYKLASSGEYKTIANLFGVCKSTVCEVLHEVVKEITEELENEFIQFPTTREAIQDCVVWITTLLGISSMCWEHRWIPNRNTAP